MYRIFHGVPRVVIVASMLVAASCARQETDDANQLSFSTPDSAVSALVAALEKRDLVTMRRLFGPETEGLMSSETRLAIGGTGKVSSRAIRRATRSSQADQTMRCCRSATMSGRCQCRFCAAMDGGNSTATQR